MCVVGVALVGCGHAPGLEVPGVDPARHQRGVGTLEVRYIVILRGITGGLIVASHARHIVVRCTENSKNEGDTHEFHESSRVEDTSFVLGLIFTLDNHYKNIATHKE